MLNSRYRDEYSCRRDDDNEGQSSAGSKVERKSVHTDGVKSCVKSCSCLVVNEGRKERLKLFRAYGYERQEAASAMKSRSKNECNKLRGT